MALGLLENGYTDVYLIQGGFDAFARAAERPSLRGSEFFAGASEAIRQAPWTTAWGPWY